MTSKQARSTRNLQAVVRFEQDGRRHSGSYRRQYIRRRDYRCDGDARIGTGGAELRAQPGRPDVQGGRLVFDYNGAASPAATIEGLLNASYDGGQWDVGLFKNSTAGTSGLTLGWLDDPLATR